MVLVKGCSKVVKGITRAQVISTTMMKFSLTNWTAVFRKLQIDKKNPIKSSVIRDFSWLSYLFGGCHIIYCETWMRHCQAHCQENKRKVPESLLLTAWLCMQPPGPRNGAAILEAFPSSGNIAAPFLGPVFGPIFGTTKEQTGAARQSWRPGFRPFAGASLPSAMQATMATHIHIILWGDMAQKLFWISEKGPLSGAARSHANLLRSGSVPPLLRLCQEAVLGVRRALVAVHPVRALWNIL